MTISPWRTPERTTNDRLYVPFHLTVLVRLEYQHIRMFKTHKVINSTLHQFDENSIVIYFVESLTTVKKGGE